MKLGEESQNGRPPGYREDSDASEAGLNDNGREGSTGQFGD